MEEIRTWEEATRLTKSQKIKILIDVLIAISNIVTAIINKNIAWGMSGILWLLIGIIECCSFKILNGDDYQIEMLEEHTRLQEGIINALLKETAVEIEVDKIKIPEHFSKPNPKKMQQKYNYYRKNHKFESQIIIDPNYNLLDGYTSYLIAKKCHRVTVIGKLQKRKIKEEN